MVRSNELSFARRGALSKLAARRQGARPGVLTGLLVGLDPDDDSRVVVSFDGSEVSVLAGPQKLVPGTVVAVEVDSSNAPVRVTGPVTTRPEGLDADMPAPDAVTPMPDLAPAEFSPEDQTRVDQAVADIGEAQQSIADAAGQLVELDQSQEALAGTLEQVQAEASAEFGRLDQALTGMSGQISAVSASAQSAHNAAVTAQGAAVAAQADADEALAKYGPLDARTVAAQAKADAAQTAAQAAKTRADSAFALAETKTTAAEVQSIVNLSANGKNRIYVRTYGPNMSSGVAGDLWRVVDASNNVIAEYIFSGSAWVASMITSAQITNVDAHKLTVSGSAVMDEAVIRKVWVDGIAALSGLFSRLTVSARNLIPSIDMLSQYGSVSAADRAMLPLSEFGVDLSENAIYLTGATIGWVRAQIPVKAGERYRFSVDVKAPVAGTVFYIETHHAKADGSIGSRYAGWSNAVSNTSTSAKYVIQGAVVARAGVYESFWVEATAPADAVISIRIFANHVSGTPNAGAQFFRNLRMEAMTDGRLIVDGAIQGRHIEAQSIWAEVARLGKIITKDLIATGAVTASALNVVHVDPATGYGFRLDPEGLTILDQDGNAAIVLRSDMTNSFSVMKEGVAQASISPDGVVVGQTVTANENLLYRSVELSTILNRIPLGLVAPVVSLSGTVELTTTQRGVMNISIDENKTGVDRAVEVKARMELRNIQETLQLALYGANGSPVTVLSSVLGVQNEASFSHGRTVVEISKIMRVKPGEQWNVLAAAKSYAPSTTNQVFFDQGTYMSAVDIGPWRGEDIQAGWTSGSSSGGSTAKTTYNDDWNSTGHRTYSYTSLSHTRAGQSLVQGAVSGTNSRGHWIFPDAAIRSALSGATVNSGNLIIRNQHSYANSGMTAVVKTHAYSSAPSTFGTATAFTSVHVPKGGTVSIPLTPAILAGLKSGTVRGFSLDHGGGTSTSHYGYFSPSATLKLNYTK